MYDETDYLDHHDPHHHPMVGVDGSYSAASATNCSAQVMVTPGESLRLPNFSLEDLSHYNGSEEAATSMGVEFQQQLGFEMEHDFNTQIMHEVLHENHHPPLENQINCSVQPALTANWETTIQEMQEMALQQQQQQQHIQLQQNLQCFSSNSFAPSVNSQQTPPDLLNLLHLPRCSVSSMLPTSSITFNNPTKNPKNFHSSLDIFSELPTTDHNTSASSVLYDPIHLSFTPQPPLLRDLFHTLPQNYHLSGSRAGSYFGLDDKETSGVFQEGDGRQFGNSVLDFRREMSKGNGRGTNHFATEKQRRVYFNKKYDTLRGLVPNPTKADRASIVGDAIEYIKELLRTVDELKILVEKKRSRSDGRKKLKMEDEAAGDMESSSLKPLGAQTDKEQTFNGSLRSSWLQRTSKEGTLLDVRIVDDEVNIKLTHKKKRNCLLFVSRILDELQLEIIHATGAKISDNYIFMFNTKISEGSSVYASAIAKKLIDVVDIQYPTFLPKL